MSRRFFRFLFLFARIYLGEFLHRRDRRPRFSIKLKENRTEPDCKNVPPVCASFCCEKEEAQKKRSGIISACFDIFRDTSIRRKMRIVDSRIVRRSFWRIGDLNRRLKATRLDYNPRVSVSLDSRGKPEDPESQAEKLSRWWQASRQITK